MHISVIVPVYNAVRYLQEAVQSALHSAATAEIVLVEDGSTDGSFELCKQLNKQYANVTLVHFPNRQNKGPAAARNLGIKSAKYEFIAFLDADDFYLPSRFVTTQLVLQTDDSCSAVYAPVGFYYKKRMQQQLHRTHDGPLEKVDFRATTANRFFEEYVLGERGYIHLNGMVIKRQVFYEVGGFDERLRHGEDTDLIYRLALKEMLLPVKSGRVVAKIRVHAQRSVYNLQSAYPERKRFFQKWLKLAVQNNWSGTVNRYLLRRTLELEFLTRCAAARSPNNDFRRLGFKSLQLLKYCWQFPALIGRCIKI